MGQIKKIIKTAVVPEPLFNTRLVVELCENVHVHYRNIRLEFDKNEFLILLDAFKQINADDVTQFKFGSDKYKNLVQKTLPPTTEFNARLQIEEQVEGHYHIHYRNLRIECNCLSEIGIDK